MSLLQSIIMGLIQGLTEFLPVSSSGHLALFKELFEIEEPGMFFDVLLHIGTLLAVFVVYYKDIWKMIAEFFLILRDVGRNLALFSGNLNKREKKPYIRVINNSYRKFVMLVLVSTIPTGIIGYTAKDLVEMAGQLLIVPGVCLILTSVLLLIADHVPDKGKQPRNITYTNAFIVGICQGIATLPGLGAMILELKDVDVSQITGNDVMNYVIGTLVAAVVGYICIKTMLVVVRKKKFTIFSIYCLLVGAASIGIYFYAV